MVRFWLLAYLDIMIQPLVDIVDQTASTAWENYCEVS